MELKEVIRKNIDITYIKQNYPVVISCLLLMVISVYLFSSIYGSAMLFISFIPTALDVTLTDFNINETANVEHLLLQSRANFLFDVTVWSISIMLIVMFGIVLLFMASLNELLRIITGTRTQDEKLDEIIMLLKANKIDTGKIGAVISALIAKGIAQKIIDSIISKVKK